MIYQCKICKKEFVNKSDYEYHINKKKNPCSPEQRMISEIKGLTCPYCNEIFTLEHNLKRHLKNKSCKTEKILQNIKDENGNIIDINEYLKDPNLFNSFMELINSKKQENTNSSVNNLNSNNTSQSNINSNNVNNINKLKSNLINNVNANIQNNNNIVILSAFGKEGRIKVPKKLLHCLYRNLEEGLPKLVKYIHYNDDFPQFQNIQGKGYDSSIVTVFDGENWILKRKDEAIESLIKEKKEIFDDFFDELEENKHSKLNQKIIQNYNKQSDKLDNVLNKEFYGTQPDKDSKALYKSVHTNINILMENERIKGKPQINNKQNEIKLIENNQSEILNDKIII
jgi:uncharacterized C2H2 Zn-finger protein